MAPINRWVLSCQGRVANIWYNQDNTVLGLNPTAGPQAPADNNILTLHDIGGGNVALQCGGGDNAFASLQYLAGGGMQTQFQNTDSGSWITSVGDFETLQLVPTGDGYFEIHFPIMFMYMMVDPDGDPNAQNCNPLAGGAAGPGGGLPARFTATGLDRPIVLDFVEVARNASGLSFSGISLANVDLSGPTNLSSCDFRGVTSLDPCNMAGANLQGAQFGGLHLAGLGLSGADCTGADFTTCDLTGFTPGTPPPTLVQADLSGATIPAGISWSGASMHGAILAGANLAGADLSGAGTDLSDANLSGAGGVPPVYTNPYKGGGIGGYDLMSPADLVIAYDASGQGKLQDLVCYRPGRGAIFVIENQGDNNFKAIYHQGDQGSGIAGFSLGNPADRIIAFDYTGKGLLDHLLCFRPGAGLVQILKSNGDGTFSSVFTSTTGIGGFPVSNSADQIIAYDYAGKGVLDHLVCYTPGTGVVQILQNADGTFSSVFSSTSGIGGYDLGSGADLIVAYDWEGSGNLNYLVCYRPGQGAVFIVYRQDDGTFGHVYAQGGGGSGIGGFDLSSPVDRIIAFDYEGTGRLDNLLCYRPGYEMVRILQKQADNSFLAVFHKPGGIGGYDLAVSSDQIIAYDYSGSGTLDCLTCYRPGTGMIWIIEPTEVKPPTLTGCKLGQANLSGAHLEGMDLTTPASLTGANLSGAHLADATLSGVDLTGTNFAGCDLSTTHFSPLKRSTDPNNPTIFAKCTHPYAVIGLDWSCLDLTATTIVGLPTDLTGLVAVGTRRPNGDFTGYILDGANFSSATLDNALFVGAKLRLAQGQKVTFAGARLTGAHFTRAVLDQVQFTPAALGGVRLNQAAAFSFSFISNCDFTGSNLYGVSFASATLLSGNVLAGATSLQQASFANAYLPNADFTGANLQGAKFDGAFMVECVLTNADLTPAEQGAIAASLTSACLQAAALQGTKLGGADLTDAAITNAKGQINQQYYDENGKLTPMFPMRFPAGVFPAVSSFSDDTTCPDGFTYGTDINNGKTIEQMMTAENPPTQWKPVGAPDDWRRS